MSEPSTVEPWRPVGPAELDLVREAGMRAFPPRLPDQPIFYPVTSRDYAVRIARDWNVPASGCGFVTRFLVRSEALVRWPRQEAGGRALTELWVPAEELDDFNTMIVGEIEVTDTFGEVPDPAGPAPR